MAQHRRAYSSGPDSTVGFHLKDKGHSFAGHNMHIFDMEEKWFARVKEAIYVKI